ncbi:MAG: hypothetical protein JWQ01_960 [Massilia sp.]|jgi:DNA-binding ferritin-like protein (Dps family)|nr:hypothetical protein [Massilia sp.]
MKTISHRLYSDYLMPSRLTEHADFIRVAQAAGYTQTSVRDYFKALRAGHEYRGKVVVHRHDIDTDLRTARKLFEIEKKYHIKSSFYFRLSTLDFGLMREIEAYGSEASYHYEELATFAKRNKIKDAAGIRERMPEIRDEFARNLNWIEQRLGTKMSTVASHGDFANRYLKLNNTAILDDRELRERCGIDCETYDQALLDHTDIYISDRPPPQFYHPVPPIDALRRYRRIYLLTHPRQCETNWKANTKENLFRFYQGLTW